MSKSASDIDAIALPHTSLMLFSFLDGLGFKKMGVGNGFHYSVNESIKKKEVSFIKKNGLKLLIALMTTTPTPTMAIIILVGVAIVYAVR